MVIAENILIIFTGTEYSDDISRVNHSAPDGQ